MVFSAAGKKITGNTRTHSPSATGREIMNDYDRLKRCTVGLDGAFINCRRRLIYYLSKLFVVFARIPIEGY
jgi:hypothetical protein